LHGRLLGRRALGRALSGAPGRLLLLGVALTLLASAIRIVQTLGLGGGGSAPGLNSAWRRWYWCRCRRWYGWWRRH